MPTTKVSTNSPTMAFVTSKSQLAAEVKAEMIQKQTSIRTLELQMTTLRRTLKELSSQRDALAGLPPAPVSDTLLYHASDPCNSPEEAKKLAKRANQSWKGDFFIGADYRVGEHFCEQQYRMAEWWEVVWRCGERIRRRWVIWHLALPGPNCGRGFFRREEPEEDGGGDGDENEESVEGSLEGSEDTVYT